MSTYGMQRSVSCENKGKNIRRKSRWIGFLMMMVLMLAVPATAQAATLKASISGASTPSKLKVGQSFTVKGKVTAKKKLSQVRVFVYNASTKKVQMTHRITKVNSKKCDISKADAYLAFNKLPAGTYYYRVYCIAADNSKKYVINKKFTVVGDGKISISNPRPSANISLTKGSSYSLQGKITSTYKLASVNVTLVGQSSKKTYFSKTVKPNKTSYNLKGSALDAALAFDKLTKTGGYTLKVTAKDAQGKTATLINRTIKITTKTSTTTTSTGGLSPSTGGSTYLNTTSKVTVPSKFTKRTTRPAASNVYYYNKNYNIYYGYNSLAPTGKKSGSSYVIGNCTWYACGRAMEIVAQAGGSISKVQAIFGGDPVGIWNANKKLGKFKYGTTPKIGALAIFNYGPSGDAHIAVVEDVVNGVPYVSESGYKIGSTKPNAAKSNIVFYYQSIYNWAGGRQLLGYIYLR